MKALRYHGYTIRSYPRKLTSCEEWTIKISISWQSDGASIVKEYSADSPFAFEREADIPGITFGQRS